MKSFAKLAIITRFVNAWHTRAHQHPIRRLDSSSVLADYVDRNVEWSPNMHNSSVIVIRIHSFTAWKPGKFNREKCERLCAYDWHPRWPRTFQARSGEIDGGRRPPIDARRYGRPCDTVWVAYPISTVESHWFEPTHRLLCNAPNIIDPTATDATADSGKKSTHCRSSGNGMKVVWLFVFLFLIDLKYKK